ncbi:MAG: glycosyltransferase family 2 protein [Bacteroidales bacterium]|jgi:rhamnosyltransferase|nr:glycosyltransferase family 2 protein [Bacteroidales bacterium]
MQIAEKEIIFAGIVLYNPDIKRLKENLLAILPQVDKVLIVDNASSNTKEIEFLLNQLNIGALIQNSENKGIASALNQLLSWGKRLNADWVITLDQDSVCPNNLISNYRKYLWDNIGIVTCLINDRNTGINIKIKPTTDWEHITWCITSASLTNIKVWEIVGGFDENMFIDSVDRDYCYSLDENGFKILRVNTIELLHEVGVKSKRIKLFGKEQIIFNHSAARCYYMARNLIYNSKKHKKAPKPCRRLITISFRMLLIIFYEHNRYNKVAAMLKGCFDGYKIQFYK